MANYELGKIKVLHGLSKVELNDKFIAIDGERTDENGLLRYKCMLVDNPTESFFIKASNLSDLPSPTSEDLEEFDITMTETQDIFREIRQTQATAPSTSIESLYELGQQKLERIKKLNPEMGVVYSLCADFVRMKDETNTDRNSPIRNNLYRSAPTQAAFLKIAIANLDTSDYDMNLMARTSYSGACGDMGDLQSELEQLMIIIDRYNKEEFDTYHLIVVGNLLNQNKLDEAFEFLNIVRAKVQKGLPIKSSRPGRNESEVLHAMTMRGYYEYYKKGKDEEIKGDKIYEENYENGDRWRQHYLAAGDYNIYMLLSIRIHICINIYIQI